MIKLLNFTLQYTLLLVYMLPDFHLTIYRNHCHRLSSNILKASTKHSTIYNTGHKNTTIQGYIMEEEVDFMATFLLPSLWVTCFWILSKCSWWLKGAEANLYTFSCWLFSKSIQICFRLFNTGLCLVSC